LAAQNSVQMRALEMGIDLQKLPAHVAIIMDGNGRWASRQGLGRLLGHRQGYHTLRDVLLGADQLGIRHLTVYGFSAENWRRPESEVGGLMKLIDEAARTELKRLIKENVRVQVAGRLDELPEWLQGSLRSLIEETKGNTGITFILAINYGGRAEIIDAIKSLLDAGVSSSDLTEERLREELYCPEVPDPDLMIRTAGEMRWSNFLLWQAAYAELFVTPVSWPEFGMQELLDGVRQYQARERKFGGLNNPQ
jgi:undecaprenyl diphosphate synthase